MNPPDPVDDGQDLPSAVEERANSILLGPAPDVAVAFAALCDQHPAHRAALLRLRADFGRAARLLDDPLPVVAALPEPIGPYRFIRQIGEGAFGVVFLAEQDQPIRRQVAIKLLHGHLYSQAAIARFLNERETLARMDHSAIARIFDAGVDAAARPYIVMEHVPGEPLHAYVAKRACDLYDRIRLFLDVCEGVNHAHQRGVIHRDLKPQNVLVAAVDGRATPKVIDFGLAKVIAADQEHTAVRTRQGVVLGTPAYMSPEQVRGDARDVDTRTDVYSLGVMLYELLAGARPFAPESYQSTTLAELQRMLTEVDAPLLSARAAQAGQPHASRLRGDLDWILRKAMARHRDERYASVGELVADLRRYLAHHPVLAGPPSVRYLLRKFVRRHRVPVAAAAVVLATLIAGLAISTRLYWRAHENAVTATKNLGDFWRLADVLEWDELTAEEKALWPSMPERLAAHERWLERVRGLSERRGLHAHTVAELDARLAGASPLPADEARGASYLRDRLQRLLLGIDELTRDGGLHAYVARRTEFTRTVYERSVDWPRAAWERAAANVAASPRFAGLRLEPIVGLLPLGADPVSGLEEFAHLQSGTVPVRGPDGRVVIADDTAIILVLIPGGDTMVGNQARDPAAPHYDPHRKPFDVEFQHVQLAPFLIGKYELTQSQVRALGVPSQSMTYVGLEGITPRHPEQSVTPQAVTDWLPHFELRLPDMHEWEAAARAGATTIWISGGEVASLQGHGNLADATISEDPLLASAPYEPSLRDDHVIQAPVGTFSPNGYGLYDVVGNLTELATTVFKDRPDKDRPDQGGVSFVARGGGFRSMPKDARVGAMWLVLAHQTAADCGVRVARDVVLKTAPGATARR